MKKIAGEAAGGMGLGLGMGLAIGAAVPHPLIMIIGAVMCVAFAIMWMMQ